MLTQQPKRHAIRDIDDFIRILHGDPRYALAFRNEAERHITLKLRRKFLRSSSEIVADAFNTALVNFLQTKTFSAQAFLDGQPSQGWSAEELAHSKLGGYLYMGAKNALIQSWRRAGKNEIAFDDEDDQDTTDSAATSINLKNLADTSLFSDPDAAYEHKTMLQRLLDCVGKLSETLRTTMEFFLDDCSMEVISERQGINVATVKSRMHAARKLVVECGRKGVPNHV